MTYQAIPVVRVNNTVSYEVGDEHGRFPRELEAAVTGSREHIESLVEKLNNR